MTTTGALKPGIMSNDRCMVGSVTIRSNLHVENFDMNSRTHKNDTLSAASYSLTSQAEVNRTSKSELSSSILQK